MINGGVNFAPDARNFRLQRRNPGMQLVDREGIEILPGERGEGIALPFWKNIVHIHAESVDRCVGHVNKPRRKTRQAGQRWRRYQP